MGHTLPGLLASPQEPSPTASEATLMDLVLDTLTSAHSRRSYRTGLEQFFSYVQRETAQQGSARVHQSPRGLRRGELVRLVFEDLQMREARWVIPDLPGRGSASAPWPFRSGSRTA